MDNLKVNSGVWNKIWAVLTHSKMINLYVVGLSTISGLLMSGSSEAAILSGGTSAVLQAAKGVVHG